MHYLYFSLFTVQWFYTILTIILVLLLAIRLVVSLAILFWSFFLLMY